MSFILKASEPFTKEEVTKLVAENISVLDEHLELIGNSLGTRTEKWCNLVGIGNDNQLVIIEVEERYTDRMLSSILCKLDSVWDNMDTIARLYPSYGIERLSNEILDSQPPSLLVINGPKVARTSYPKSSFQLTT